MSPLNLKYMGTIDELNFKVILDDAEFNEKAQKDIKTAEKLNISLSKYLEVKGKLNSRASGLSAKEAAERKRAIDLNTKEAVSQEKVRLAKTKTAAAQARLNKILKEGNIEQKKQVSLMSQIAPLAAGYLSVRGVSEFLSQMVKVTGELETQRVALSAMLQNGPAADNLISQIQGLAVESPYQFTDLVKYAKQLSAFGTPVHNIFNDMKMLADISAGLGVDMGRIVLAWGQIQSAGFLKGTELRQLTETGIPILQTLADSFSEMEGKAVTVGEVFDKISSREVSFEMVADSFRKMTSEGGKFYKMQEVLASSLEGKLSNLSDAFDLMLSQIGENNERILKGGVDFARLLIENYEKIGKALVFLITTYGTYKTVLASVRLYEKAALLTTQIKEYMAMGRALGFATANHIAFNTAAKANIYVALASAVVGLGAAIFSFNKKQKEAIKTTGEASRVYREEADELKKLFSVMKNETASREKKQEALDKLNSKYGEYLDNTIKETDSVDNLSKAYDRLTASITEKYLAEQKAIITGSAQTEYNDAEASLLGLIQNFSKESNLSSHNQGRIIAELQNIIGKYSKYWEASDIYTKILKTFEDFGSNKFSARDEGKLYSAVWDFKETQKALALANRSYENFAKGYSGVMDSLKTDSVEGAEEVTTKLSSIAKAIQKTTKDIEKYEKKAASSGLTDAEIKKLQSLRESLKDDKNLYKDLAGKDYDATDDKKALKAEADRIKEMKKIEREAVRAQWALIDAEIEAMDEGHAKRLAKIEQQHREAEQALIWAYEDEVEGMDENAANKVASLYSDKLMAETLQYSANVAKEEGAILEEREKARLEYVQKYGKLLEKEKAITEKYAKEIAKARAEGNEYKVKTLEADRDAELYDLKKQYSGLYALIFTDASDLADNMLAKAIQVTQEEIQKAAKSGNIEHLTELYERLREQMEEMTSRKNWGFKSIIEGFKLLKDADIAYTNGIVTGDNNKIGEAASKNAQGKALIASGAGEISDMLDKLGDTLKEFGGVAAEIGGIFQGLASNTENIVTAFTSEKKGDLIAAGFESALQLAEMVGRQIAENKKAQEDWSAEIRQSAHEYAMLKIEALEYKESNIFNIEDPYKEATASALQYLEAMKHLQAASDALGEGQVQTGTRRVVNGQNIAKGLAAGAGLGAAIGSIIPGLGTAVGAAIGAAVGGIVGAASVKVVPVFESLSEKYGYIVSENFELNPEILADYDKLDDATKKLVDNWEEVKKAAEDAQEQMRDSLGELVGSLGNDLSDALVEAFRNNDIYSALDDFEDSVEKVFENLISQAIFAAVFQKALEEMQKGMEDSMMPGGDGDIKDDILNFFNKAPELFGAYNEAMKEAQAQADAMGLDIFQPTGGSGFSSIGSGIQSVTENTANLLGSYINAIRVDVALERSLLQTHLPQISDVLARTCPSLLEYQAQIAANTYDTAQRAAEIAQTNAHILSELRSVITTEGGDSAFRTY